MTPSSFRSRRILAPLAGAAVLMLAACGPSVGGDTGEEAEAVDFSGVEPADEITFWSNHPGESLDLERELINRFTEETGIAVELVTAGSNYEEVTQRFQTAQTSGDVGDVVVVSDATWFPNYLNDSLLDITSVLEAAEIDTSTYQETLYQDYTYEDGQYGVPYARSTPIFYYNKDQYEEAGLEDAAPATWDDVKANSEALVEAGAADAGFGYPPGAEYPAWAMTNLVWSYGGAWSDDWDFAPLTSQETVDALTFAQDSVQDGWARVTSGDQAVDFAAGGISQTIQSTGSLGTILETADFEVGVGYLPSGPAAAEEGIVPPGGAGLAIASQSTPERQLASAMFIDFMTNAESTAYFSEGTGYLPVRTDVDMSAVYEETPQFEVAVEQLENARTQDFARTLLPGGDLALADALSAILTTDADVAQTLQETQDEFQSTYESDLQSDLEN